MTGTLARTPSPPALSRPRLGFLGVGWIGRDRMAGMLATGAVEAAGVVDPSPDNAAEAARLAPEVESAKDLDALLGMDLDGVVIATPSALHADQAVRALERGLAVFCQKPLGRSAAEARRVVDAARAADRLLGVDMSYRATEAMERIRRLVGSRELGPIHAVDLVFHNAYGPDKAWFYDPALSGGGCLMDLGVHLVDLMLWTLDFPEARVVSSHLFAEGRRLEDPAARCEDLALATLELGGGGIARLACSWRLHAGRDAVIEAHFHGANGAAVMRNVDGSFYDFVAERHQGTTRRVLAEPPDAWGARAAADWARRLAASRRYDPAVETVLKTSAVLDDVYAHQARTRP
ncbi:MAG: Gfo/Idh/MocA family oxidoreductase, partial [Brevundimonas sp.]